MFSINRLFCSRAVGSLATSGRCLGSSYQCLGPAGLRFSSSAAAHSYDEDDDDDDVEQVTQIARGELPKIKERNVDATGYAYGTGRRKTSVARVWIREGCGEIVVNGKNFVDYFTQTPREHILESFITSKTSGFFDVRCTTKGGGPMGQAGAVRLGVARALEAYDPMLRPVLRSAGLLTRDSRRVERKKPGQKKARKKFQWVKR